MTYFKDLSRYEYSKDPDWCAGDVRNVGWLDARMAFPKGNVDAEVLAKLLALCKRPVNRYRSWHRCHFCNEYPVTIATAEGDICFGDGEIRVPWNDGSVVYAAPNLIYFQKQSLQLRVLRLGLFQDRNVGVGIFPEHKEVFVCSKGANTGGVSIRAMRCPGL